MEVNRKFNIVDSEVFVGMLADRYGGSGTKGDGGSVSKSFVCGG